MNCHVFLGNEQVGPFLVVKLLDQLVICSIEVFGSFDRLVVRFSIIFLIVLVVLRIFLLWLFFASFSIVPTILTVLLMALVFMLSVVYLGQRHMYQVCACPSEAVLGARSCEPWRRH
jgi:fatty acid desaturase